MGATTRLNEYRDYLYFIHTCFVFVQAHTYSYNYNMHNVVEFKTVPDAHVRTRSRIFDRSIIFGIMCGLDMDTSR